LETDKFQEWLRQHSPNLARATSSAHSQTDV
jgi:hypothetical protein